MYALALILGAVGAVAAQQGNSTEYALREVGARNTVEWRVWLEKNSNPISPWHDIPLYPDNKPGPIVNFVVEIPRWTDGKVETQRNEPLNPLFHDTKKKKPRFVASFFPHKSYPFLYGSIPQTWESPHVKDNYTGFVGDNDPVDLFDISSIQPGYAGEVKQVKVLGGLAMIDDDTTDWKVIAVDVRDPLAKLVNSVEDVEKYRPGVTQSFHDWFIYYKIARGKGLNTIVGNAYVNASTMLAKLVESHQHWRDLALGRQDKGEISVWQTTNPRACKTYVKPEEAGRKFGIPDRSKTLPAAARPAPYDRWYYLDGGFGLVTVPGDVVEVE
ncbi:hypothetical protein QQS21_008130 [Conoideocrella luteorostrata]|uniref:inorganic diphosphatase n=1 Tax=Conoideocrella luteorostrata TaxID=1105319 RepID=A0AAJ0FRF5_9HYPO|nr:hypothetical protein QQS21_008130 [Conoideocrella luteorostrata]